MLIVIRVASKRKCATMGRVSRPFFWNDLVMKFYAGILSLAGALLLFGGASAAPALAQDDNGAPAYTTWQPGWDTFQFDKRHVMLGTVQVTPELL